MKEQTRHTTKKTRRQIVGKIRVPFIITRWTVLFALLVLISCAGASALVIQHISNKPVPKTSSNPTSNSDGSLLCFSGQPSCPLPSNTSAPTHPALPQSDNTTTPTTPTKTNDIAVATAPQYSAQYLACISGDSGKITLSGLYSQTSKWLTGEVVSVGNAANSHSITTQQGVESLNSYITTAISNNTGSYQMYLKGRHDNGCSVDVQPPTSIPLCDLYGSLASCMDTIRNNDSNWGNLINDMADD